MSRRARQFIVFTAGLLTACQGVSAGVEMEPVSQINFMPVASAACNEWNGYLLSDGYIEEGEAGHVLQTCTDIVSNTADVYGWPRHSDQSFPIAQSVVKAIDPRTGLNDARGHDLADVLSQDILKQTPPSLLK